jgi:restriction system protein
MTIPAYKDVDLALLLELVRRRSPVRPVDIYADIERHFPHLSREELALTRSDGRTKVFHNMIHWARDRIKRRGLLASASGPWSVVPGAAGAVIEDLIARGAKPDQRVNDFVNGTEAIPSLLGQGWATPVRSKPTKGGAPRRGQPVPDTEPTPLVGPEHGVAVDHREQIRAALLSRLGKMQGYEFEQLVAKLLDALGFRDTQVVGRSGDEGVDLLTYLHSPLIRARVAVQVKRHTANVGPKDISYLRDRWSRRADRLLFVTTSDYTAGAQEVASDQGDAPVELINGKQLIDVMIGHGIGVQTQPLVRYETDEEFFSGI